MIVDEPSGARIGLVLFPEETQYFPAEIISPYNGVGLSPEDSSFRIISYQLNKEPCPHVEKAGDTMGCKIYQNRLLVCKSYPFYLSLFNVRDYLPTHSLDCTAIRTSGSSQFQIPDCEWESGRQVVERVAAIRAGKSWVFDLEACKWLPIKKASTRRRFVKSLKTSTARHIRR